MSTWQFLLLSLIGLPILWVVGQDVGLVAQGLFGLTAAFAVLTLRLFGFGGWFRTSVILMAVFIAYRYIVWRTTYTMPPTESWSFYFGLTLYAAELYGLCVYFLSIFINSPARDRELKPLPAEPAHYPSVDVLIPTYNEDLSIVRTTALAALAMDYPSEKLRVHVLDDGGTAAKLHASDPLEAEFARSRAARLKKLCAELGVRYQTRADNAHAKAGNLNEGLRHSRGELVMILDADHVPMRDFLKRTVGQFVHDPKMALIQTPHFFGNPDPVDRNLGLFRKMPNESELFYSHTQMGLDFWNANLFCGSAALIRRSALEHVGGIGTTSVTEDAETSLELHSRGYHSGFMKRPLVVGLAPDTLQTFVGQRSRWSQGMIQLLMLKNPLFKSGLNIAQRLCYLSSMIFWLFPIARLFFIVAPFFYIFFGLKIFEARVNEFMVFVLPHIFVLLTLTNHMTGSTRWPFLSDLYETLMAPYLVKPVLSAIWNPKNPKFNVTPKNENVDQAHVSSAAGPLVLMTLLILAAEIVGIIRYFQFPLEREHLTIVLSWNTVNLILATAALGVAFERPVRGLRKLLPLKQPVQVLTADGEQLPGLAVQGDPDRLAIRVAHLGAGGGTGAKLAVARSFEGEPTGTPVPATVIGTGMSEKGPEIIVKLEPVEPIERITAVELAYGTSQELNNFAGSRQGQRSVIGSLLALFFAGLSQVLRAPTYMRGRQQRDEELSVTVNDPTFEKVN